MQILQKHFPRLSDAAVDIAGHTLVVTATITAATGWIVFGFVEGFPTEWFLVSNIFGTLVAVLVLLLVQHSQNRDMRAMQAKVDELLRSSVAAGNHLIGAEKREADDLQNMVRDRQAATGLSDG